MLLVGGPYTYDAGVDVPSKMCTGIIWRGGTGLALWIGCQWIVVERVMWSSRTGKPGAGSVRVPRQIRGLLAQVRSIVLLLCMGVLG